MDKEHKRILTILNVKLHRLYGKIQGSIMSFGINKGYFLSAIIGLASLVNLFYTNYIDKFNSINYDFKVWMPFIVALSSTTITTFTSLANYVNHTKNYKIITSKLYKDKVIKKIKLNERYESSKYEISYFYNGAEKEHYIISDEINNKLIDGWKIRYEDLGYKFKLANEIREFVPSVLKRTLSGEKIVFNGKLVRMYSDLFLDRKSILIQQAGYFDGQCSNELVFKKIKSNDSLNPPFLGEQLLIDKESYLYDLDFSPCANYIGASTMVITSDNYIIIGKQGDLAKANAGRYAPSGSGSVNYKDIKNSRDFNSLLINAMEREFSEENNYILGRDSIKTVLIGYCRLIERGGKPDFFGVSRLKASKNELYNKIKSKELGIADPFELLKIDSGLGIGGSLKEFCEEHIKNRKISIQVKIITDIILKLEAKGTGLFACFGF